MREKKVLLSLVVVAAGAIVLTIFALLGRNGSQSRKAALLTREPMPTGIPTEASVSTGNNNQRTDPNPVTSLPTEIPERIKSLLAIKHEFPREGIVGILRDRDEPVLVALYEQEIELTNRWALTWALAAVGRDDAARALQATLTGDYAKPMTVRDREIIRDTLEALGFVAGRSDSAYFFLIEASEPEFWARRRSWKMDSPHAEAAANSTLAGLAIQSMGSSGRMDIIQRLHALRNSDLDALDWIRAPLTTAAFYNHIVSTEDPEELLAYHLSGEKMLEEFRRWRTESEDGESWWNWNTNIAARIHEAHMKGQEIP